MSTDSVRDAAYSTGYISMANAGGLVTGDPQQAAVAKFERAPLPPSPVSVNAWSHAFEQTEKGRIIGNVVI
ncbi:MAG: hypothetical protein ACLGQW_01055 [Acidobacteriota bacterium]